MWDSWDEHLRDRNASPIRDLTEGLEGVGILRTIQIDHEYMQAVAQPLIQALSLHAEDLRRTKSFQGAWPKKSRERTFTLGGRWLPSDLKDILIEENLGFYKFNLSHMDEWLRMPSVVGRLYHGMLVSSIAKDRMSSCVGDRFLPTIDLPEWDTDSIAQVMVEDHSPTTSRSIQSYRSALGMLSIRALILTQGQIFDADKIRRVRDSNRGELTAFQDYIQQVLASEDGQEPRWANDDSIQEHLAIQYERHVYPGLLELRRSLRGLGVASIWSAVSVKTAIPPSIATAIAATLPESWVSGATIGTGLAIGLTSILSDHRKAVRDARKSQPQAYLLSVQNEGPLKALRRLRSLKPPSSLI
ncbi:hypothetical protein SAMN05421874_14043 [Nonomuraea maritima]|uniref:Uncharacterized protein n=1 Tax=Nonomuraea maritima TaxID=683260 RepID=A0A1G9QUE8_9ACTN|nr:hypothetical protein SAMN05421874_14043 [Nonomuraea maritima]